MHRILGNLRSIATGKDPRAAFHVAFAYLLWCIVPHFHLLIHSHTGGEHSHPALTGAQVRLANSVIEGLGTAGLQVEPNADFGGGERTVHPFGEPSLSTGTDHALHAHFWEDANLASASSAPDLSLAAADIPFLLTFRYLSPVLSLWGTALARGPPPTLFA